MKVLDGHPGSFLLLVRNLLQYQDFLSGWLDLGSF